MEMHCCFSMATMVARTFQNVTLYVYCLSCVYRKYYVFGITQIISRTGSYFPIYGVSYRTVNGVQSVNRFVSA
jgi:hypothetical protein